VIQVKAVFNIKGNDYRLVAALQYPAGILAVKFFGTHAERIFLHIAAQRLFRIE